MSSFGLRSGNPQKLGWTCQSFHGDICPKATRQSWRDWWPRCAFVGVVDVLMMFRLPSSPPCEWPGSGPPLHRWIARRVTVRGQGPAPGTLSASDSGSGGAGNTVNTELSSDHQDQSVMDICYCLTIEMPQWFFLIPVYDTSFWSLLMMQDAGKTFGIYCLLEMLRTQAWVLRLFLVSV